MTIDTERLKTDAAYWDEVAPEGATHFFPPSGDWYKDAERGLECWSESLGFWVPAGFPDRLEDRQAVPRPTAPAAPEWDGKSDPAPGELAVISGGKCQVLGWDSKRNQAAVQWQDGEMGVINLAALKPIRTAEQRQREELIDLISHHPIYKNSVNTLADEILSRYNLEPKP